MPGPSDVVAVLCASPHQEDHRKLESIFGHSNWLLRRADSGIDACTILLDEALPVIIAESDLSDRSWISLMEWCSQLPDPKPRVIVASRLADDGLWQQVLSLGGYNVLAKPFDPREVFWVVRHAWLDWKCEYDRIGAQSGAGVQTMAVGA